MRTRRTYSSRRPFAVALLLPLIGALFAMACGGGVPDHGSVTPATLPERALIPVDLIRIIDGDTIEVRFANGARDTVRYIGVDTPETVAPGQPVQAFGPEASARNAQLLGAGAVFLESDLTDRDRFDRLLRYVWVDDGSGTLLFVNLVLVAEGLATVRTYPPDVKYLAHYQAAEAVARAAARGIWSAAKSASQNCAPSYPNVCIPPPPPDLNCGDIPFRRFRVTGTDPHRFDGDRDGLGCERLRHRASARTRPR